MRIGFLDLWTSKWPYSVELAALQLCHDEAQLEICKSKRKEPQISRRIFKTITSES